MNLIWLNFSYFLLVKDGRTLAAGTLKTVVKRMLKEGFYMSDIEMALGEMDDQEHNFACFGVVNYGFIYSEYKKEYDSSKEYAA